MRPSHSFHFMTEGNMVRYEADAEGFRNGRTQRHPAPSRKIIVAGDSFVWGYGVESGATFARILETELGSTQIRNIGMPGFGLDQIWLSLHYYGLSAQPDLVIVTIYPDNLERSMTAFRLNEGFEKPSFTLSGSELVPRRPEDCEDLIERFLERNSAIYSLWRRTTQWLARNYGVGEWWTLNEAILDAILADVERAGTRVLFVHIPYSTWQPFPALGDYMRRRNASYLDLYEAFGSNWSKYYFRKDGHLNPAGHRRLAELLRERLDR